jgi:molybdopterin-binding protein
MAARRGLHGLLRPGHVARTEIPFIHDTFCTYHLAGKVEEIKLGNVMAHVVVRVGDNIIDSVITRRRAEEMELKVGDTVAAIIKSTEVMLQKD